MNPSPSRVVYDCNIYVQALINPHGPAARCVEKARERKVLLFVSPFVLGEIREIHDKLPAKYGVAADQTDELARSVASFATFVSDVPEVYDLVRDPDDAHYVNLAIRTDSGLIVSRDRHLLELMDPKGPTGRDFQSRFPLLRIIDPVELLRGLDQPPLSELPTQQTTPRH
jgi:putative PIN family toxin of toxin-antitoxin system